MLQGLFDNALPYFETFTIKGYEKLIDKNNKINLERHFHADLLERIEEKSQPLSILCDISQGVVQAPDAVSARALKTMGLINSKKYSPGQGVFVLSEEELQSLRLNPHEMEFIKPYLQVHQVRRYSISKDQRFFLIYTTQKDNSKVRHNDLYKRLRTHLDYFGSLITSSNKPYGLHRPRKKKFFEGEKLLCKSMIDQPCFAWTDEEVYVGMSFNVVIPKIQGPNLKYILGLLNSRLGFFWFMLNAKKRGANLDIGVNVIHQFPIPSCSEIDEQEIVKLVDKRMKISEKKTVLDAERSIDHFVYKIYGLTDTEKTVIKDNTPPLKWENNF